MAPKITVGVRCDTIPNKVHTTVVMEQTHHNISKALTGRFDVGWHEFQKLESVHGCLLI